MDRNSRSEPRGFLWGALIAAAVSISVPSSSYAHDPNLEGVRIRQNGQIVVEVWQGIRTGTLTAPIGAWSSTLDIVFLDPNYHEYLPTDPEETLQWFIPNPSLLQAQQVGTWAVQLRGLAAGATTFAVVVWHIDHTAFYSGDIPTTNFVATGAPIVGGESFVLSPPSPNPARESASISYSLDREAHVCIDVFDVRGAWVESLEDRLAPAGAHEVTWAPTGVRAGVYFVRLDANGISTSQKLVLAE